MVAITARMRALRSKLLALRVGPGAAILPPDVKKIQLDFENSKHNAYLGSKKVWRQYLPRLKYYNPGVSMVVNRNEDVKGRAVMTVEFHPPNASGDSQSTATTQPADTTALVSIRTRTIIMKGRRSSEILDNLYEVTKATLVEESSEDKELRRQLASQFKERDERVQRNKEAIEAKKRQEEEEELFNVAKQQILLEGPESSEGP